MSETEVREPCPVCGYREWYIDYDFNGDDEMRVDRCQDCDWPPSYPVSVAEWRAEKGIEQPEGGA